MRRPLPHDLAWHPPAAGTYSQEPRSLRVGGPFGLEVAFVHQRVTGDWLSTINRHGDWGRQGSRLAPSRELAMKWAGWWAAARADRLRAAAEEWGSRVVSGSHFSAELTCKARQPHKKSQGRINSGGIMKKVFAAIAASVLLSACATKPIDTATAPTTPLNRVYAPELLTPSEDKVQLTVARDAGFMGSGCKTAVYFDGRIVSAISHAEKVVFYVTPGRHILGTGPNPEGKALCHVGADRARREVEVVAELGKPLKYRLALSANGEIAVMPTAF